MSYSPVEWRTLEPLARQADAVARAYPARRDLFLCHAWDDRQGAAKDLYDLLVSHGATVWFSEYDVGLGKSLLTEIDKGLRASRAGIVLVTPAMLKTLRAATGIASKELAALLATDRVIPVAHGTDFDAIRDVSPLLGARSGLATGAVLSIDEVAKKIAAATAAEDNGTSSFRTISFCSELIAKRASWHGQSFVPTRCSAARRSPARTPTSSRAGYGRWCRTSLT